MPPCHRSTTVPVCTPLRCALAIALVATTTTTAAPARAQSRAAQLRDIDAYIAKGLKDWDIPGLSIAIVKNDTVLFTKGYGVRRLGAAGAVDDQTLFGIMSTTKAFTAMAIAMLVDEGKVAWSDPVTKWLPGFEFPDPFLTREATVKDLLTHNIGLGNADLLWGRKDLARDEILKRVRYLTSAYSLRAGFVYQNVMYGAAGEVVAHASGMSWEDFIRTRIFRPLGMTRSYPTLADVPVAIDANVSSPHFRVRDTIRVIDDEPVDAVPAAGAIWSTAADMARWTRFLLDSARINGKRLVTDLSFRELFKPQATIPPGEFYPTARLTRPHWTTYGLGWFEQDYRGRFVAFHTGSLDGRTAIIGLIPDERLGVYIFGNLDHAEFRHALMLKVFDVFTNAPPRDWSAELLVLYAGIRKQGESARAATEAKRIAGTRPSLAPGAYAGTYTHPAWGDLVITLDGTTLRARIGAGATNTGVLEHWNYDTFRVTMGDGRGDANYLTFILDAAGTPGTVLLDGSADYAFKRKAVVPKPPS